MKHFLTGVQLKEFLNSLSDEQLQKPVIIWGEDKGMDGLKSVELNGDDYVYDRNRPNDGCCHRTEISDFFSQLDGNIPADSDIEVALSSGHIVIWGEPI